MLLLANEQKHRAKVRAQKDATRYCPSQSEADIAASNICRKVISMVQLHGNCDGFMPVRFVHIKLS
jgi:hypothetical protein